MHFLMFFELYNISKMLLLPCEGKTKKKSVLKQWTIVQLSNPISVNKIYLNLTIQHNNNKLILNFVNM